MTLTYQNIQSNVFQYLILISIILLFSFMTWKSKKEIFLNLGSGPSKGKNNWINVDLYGADINCDLRKGIPIKENTVDKIYTSHMFEHIPFKELKI